MSWQQQPGQPPQYPPQQQGWGQPPPPQQQQQQPYGGAPSAPPPQQGWQQQQSYPGAPGALQPQPWQQPPPGQQQYGSYAPPPGQQQPPARPPQQQAPPYGSQAPPPQYGAQSPPQYGGQPPYQGAPGAPPPYQGAPGGQPPYQGAPGGGPPSSFLVQGGTMAAYAQNMTPERTAQLQQWFSSVDRDHSGKIDVDELRQLTFGGRSLSLPTSIRLIKIFDRDFSGEIDFWEYAALFNFIERLQRAFVSADRAQRGVLEEAEVGVALQGGGFEISPPSVHGFFNKYRVDPATGNVRNSLDFSTFLAMCADIALVRHKFEFIDTQKTGAIVMRLEQLLRLVGDLM